MNEHSAATFSHGGQPSPYRLKVFAEVRGLIRRGRGVLIAVSWSSHGSFAALVFLLVVFSSQSQRQASSQPQSSQPQEQKRFYEAQPQQIQKQQSPRLFSFKAPPVISRASKKGWVRAWPCRGRCSTSRRQGCSSR